MTQGAAVKAYPPRGFVPSRSWEEIYMSVEVMRSVIDAAEGRVPVDTLFENARIVDVYGQRVVDGSVAVKGGVIVGVLVKGRDDAVGGYEAR